MTATYVQRGEAIDYANATEDMIPANTVVLIGKHIGVTGGDIAPGETASDVLSHLDRQAPKVKKKVLYEYRRTK